MKRVSFQAGREEAGQEFFLVPREMVEEWGWHKAGWITLLLSKWKELKSKNELTADEAFFFTHAEQMYLVPDLSEYKISAYKKFFKAEKLLRTELRGLPTKEFYILSAELIRFWKEGRRT